MTTRLAEVMSAKSVFDPSNRMAKDAPRGPHAASFHGDEQLIVDDRSELRPAQIVEARLAGMLNGEFAMVSQMRLKSLIAHRS